MGGSRTGKDARFEVRCSRPERARWRRTAKQYDISIGSAIRQAMQDLEAKAATVIPKHTLPQAQRRNAQTRPKATTKPKRPA